MSLSIGFNSVNANFYKNAKQKIDAGNSAKILFDNSDALSTSREDVVKNNNAYIEINNSVKSGAGSKKASEFAAQKAEEISNNENYSITQAGNKYTTGDPYLSANSITLTLFDPEYRISDSRSKNNLPVGTQIINYGEDGSYTVTTKLDYSQSSVSEIQEFYTADGVMRRKHQTDADGTVRKWQYDDTGKLNQTKIYSADKKSVTTCLYDNNGQKSKQVTEDGNIRKSTFYEYDNNGKVVGTYTVSENLITKEKTTTTTIYDNAHGTKQTIVVNPDGSKVKSEYQKDNNGNYYKTSQIDMDKKSKVTKEQTFDKPIYNEDGSFEQNVVVKQNNKTYYQTNYCDENGKILSQDRYSSDKRDHRVASWDYTYNANGQKVQTSATKYKTNSDGSETVTTTTTDYNPKTGKPIGQPKVETHTTPAYDNDGWDDNGGWNGWDGGWE